MNPLPVVWGLLFRLFPCPAPVGLRRIGTPGAESPVLLSGNFHLAVRRLQRALRGRDAWLLVANSRGINVWCASTGGLLDTDAVVRAVKTSGVGERVTRRLLVLPPLCAPGVRAAEVERRTGFRTVWGPVRLGDLPRYLDAGGVRDESMKRVTCEIGERLDSAVGSLFPVYILGAAVFALLAPRLLFDYLLAVTAAFLFFFGVGVRLPGRHGLGKALRAALLPGAALAAGTLLPGTMGPRLRADLIIALAALPLLGLELGGLSSTRGSELDPFLARIGVRRIGSLTFAGSRRTDLLRGRLRLAHEPARCARCGSCAEACPQGVWEAGPAGTRLARPDRCTACGACLLQCPRGAIRAAPGEVSGEDRAANASEPGTRTGDRPGA